jgi:hypothetical protein
MSTDYRATPEQWETIELYAEDNDYAVCFLELRDRIEALEAAQQLRTFTAEEVAPIVVPTVKESLTDPAGALLDRVADAIGAADDEGLTNMTWSNHSRAAILEVAAWLTENYARDVASPPPCQMLRNEANR